MQEPTTTTTQKMNTISTNTTTIKSMITDINAQLLNRTAQTTQNTKPPPHLPPPFAFTPFHNHPPTFLPHILPQHLHQHQRPHLPFHQHHQPAKLSNNQTGKEREEGREGRQNPERELIIHNLPYEKNETQQTLEAMILKIAKQKQLNGLTTNDFDVRRATNTTKTHDQHSTPSTILILNTNEHKQALKKWNQKASTQLTQKYLSPKYETDRPIYINENLSPKTRALYRQARTHKGRLFSFVWTTNGNILARIKQTDKIHNIENEDQLNEIIRQTNGD